MDMNHDLIQAANKIRMLGEQLQLSDYQCANIIEESEKIKFVGTDLAYVWKEDTQLWKRLTTVQEINFTLVELLMPMAKEKLELFCRCVDRTEKGMDKRICSFRNNIEKLTNTRKIVNVKNMCGNNTVSSQLFNSQITKGLYPIKSGCLDIETMTVRPRVKSDYFTFELDVDLVDETHHAQELLKSFCPTNDNDTYQYLLDILSYSSTPFNWLKKFFIFHGDGDNGKSLLLKILECILGPLATSIGKRVFSECGNTSTTTPELEQCVGKCLGTYSETTDGLLNETNLKQITGDDTISVTPKYEKTFKTRLFLKLILSGNDKPDWRYTPSMVARIEYFAFLYKFKDNPKGRYERKKNRQLEELFTAGPYKNEIFTLLMKNAQDLFKRRKIVKSKFIQKQFEKYTSEIDCTTEYLGLWRPIDNPRPSEGVIGGAVFRQFCRWCSDNNKKPAKRGDFIKKLQQRYPPRKTKYHNNTVYDICLPVEPEEYEVQLEDEDARIRALEVIKERDELEELRKLVKTQQGEIEKLKRQLLKRPCVKTVSNASPAILPHKI